jgi:hypothetical protein
MGDHEHTAVVEAHLADTFPPGENLAAMTARIAMDGPVLSLCTKLAGTCKLVQGVP